jgi:hypothetical protein
LIINYTKQYSNGGLGTIKDRFNLNINIGFRYKKVDIYGMVINALQPDYRQLHETYSVDGGDNLNRRFCVGVRIDM